MEKFLHRLSTLFVLGTIVVLVASLQAINQNSLDLLVSSVTPISMDDSDSDDDDSSNNLQIVEEEVHVSFEVLKRYDRGYLEEFGFPQHLNLDLESLKIKLLRPPSLV